MNTYRKSICNPTKMNTYKIVRLKVPLESTLTKNTGGGYPTTATALTASGPAGILKCHTYIHAPHLL